MQNNTVLDQYELSATQAASYLEISTGHLYNLIWKKRAPKFIRYGGQLRFCISELDNWISQKCEG